MAIWLILVVTIIYGCVSISYFFTGNVPFGIVFAGYAFANVGLIMVG